MKRTIISVSLLCILAATLGLLWRKSKNTKPVVTTPPQSGNVAQMLNQQSGTATTTTGKDVEIRADDLEGFDYAGGGEYKPFFAQTAKQALGDSKNVILYFYAPRDPTDQSLDQDLQERKDRIPANTIIMRINFDTEESLKTAFSVTEQNTLIFLDKQGNEKSRRAMGITSLTQIVQTMKVIGY